MAGERNVNPFYLQGSRCSRANVLRCVQKKRCISRGDRWCARARQGEVGVKDYRSTRGAAWLLERMYPHEFGPVENRRLPDEVAAASRGVQIVLSMPDGKQRRVKSFADAQKAIYPNLDPNRLLTLKAGQGINPHTGEIVTLRRHHSFVRDRDFVNDDHDDFDQLENGNGDGS